MSEYLENITKIHNSSFRFVMVSSGGGTNAISEILKESALGSLGTAIHI